MGQIFYKMAAGTLAISLLGGAAGCRINQPSPEQRVDVADTDTTIKPDTGPKYFKLGTAVLVGTVGYKAESVTYKDKLDDGTKPAAGRKFMLVKMLARNTGPKEGAIGTFKVVDGTTEYTLSEKGAKAAESFNEVKTLAKDEGKNGYLIFEVPALKAPQLQISGLPPIKDVMFIALTEPPATAKGSPAATPSKSPAAK